MTGFRDASRASLITLGAFAMLLTAACGDDSPAAQPLAPTPTSAGSATASPAPSPTRAPLSPFEADPAVIALRTLALESANAVNAGNLAFPALVAVSTPNRLQEATRALGTDIGGFAPGPYPLTPLDVLVVSQTERRIPLCTLTTGWPLTADRSGGYTTGAAGHRSGHGDGQTRGHGMEGRRDRDGQEQRPVQGRHRTHAGVPVSRALGRGRAALSALR